MHILLKYKHTIELSLLIFIAFSLVFKVSLSTPAILLLLILNLKGSSPFFSNVLKHFTITFLLIFTLYTLSAILIPQESYKLIIKTSAFIFIPVAFYVKKFSKKDLLFFTCSFLIFQIIHILYIDIIMLKALFIDKLPDFTSISVLVEKGFIIERPYFALNCLLSIICLRYILKEYNLKNYILLILLLLIVSCLIIIAARLAIGVSILLSLFMFLENRKFKPLLGFTIIVIATGLIFGKYALERITVIKGEARVAIWQCSYNIINNPDFNMLIGEFSNKKVDEKLLNCYKTKEIAEGDYFWIGKYDFRFNTHNQFLGFLTGYGIIGLFLFIWIFVLNAYNYTKNKNIFSIYFIIVFCSQSFFENILSRQQGIYVFIWFCYLFYLMGCKNNYINE